MGILRKLHEFLFRPKELTQKEQMAAHFQAWQQGGKEGLLKLIRDQESQPSTEKK
jgi:hypothetical protein